MNEEEYVYFITNDGFFCAQLLAVNSKRVETGTTWRWCCGSWHITERRSWIPIAMALNYEEFRTALKRTEKYYAIINSQVKPFGGAV